MNCLIDEILDAKYSAVINTNTASRELNCLNDEMIAKKYAIVINTNTSDRESYYYGMPGDEHDQALYSTKLPNTRAIFLTRYTRSMIKNSKTYFPIDINEVMGPSVTDQIMKLIKLCHLKKIGKSYLF